MSIASCLSSSTHPSLLQAATIQRNTVRSVLKKDRRLDPQSRSSNISTVQQAIGEYLEYLFTVDASLAGKTVSNEEIDISLRKEIEVYWRSTLSSGYTARDSHRTKGRGLDFELDFLLSSLAYTHTQQARSSLLVLYGAVAPDIEQRVKIVQHATKSLLTAASIHAFTAARSLETDAAQGVIETLSQTQSALSALAHAEATLLAVLKDDPHPFVVAQQRNKQDKDWMIKAPEIPKVRAHLFARLSLAAAEHASAAEAGLSATGRVDRDLMHYVKDLRKTARAKACRLFGIDSELEGETGKAIAWLQAAKQELGFSADKESGGSSIGLRKLKKDWMERREDKKVERSGEWGSDAGRLEELRVIEYLETKWTKMNDTVRSFFDWFCCLISDIAVDKHTNNTTVPPFSSHNAFRAGHSFHRSF